jgi:hypothetical protein
MPIDSLEAMIDASLNHQPVSSRTGDDDEPGVARANTSGNFEDLGGRVGK